MVKPALLQMSKQLRVQISSVLSFDIFLDHLINVNCPSHFRLQILLGLPSLNNNFRTTNALEQTLRCSAKCFRMFNTHVAILIFFLYRSPTSSNCKFHQCFCHWQMKSQLLIMTASVDLQQHRQVALQRQFKKMLRCMLKSKK